MVLCCHPRTEFLLCCAVLMTLVVCCFQFNKVHELLSQRNEKLQVRGCIHSPCVVAGTFSRRWCSIPLSVAGLLSLQTLMLWCHVQEEQRKVAELTNMVEELARSNWIAKWVAKRATEEQEQIKPPERVPLRASMEEQLRWAEVRLGPRSYHVCTRNAAFRSDKNASRFSDVTASFHSIARPHDCPTCADIRAHPWLDRFL